MRRNSSLRTRVIRTAPTFLAAAALLVSSAVQPKGPAYADDVSPPVAVSADGLEATSERGPVTATVNLTPKDPEIGDRVTLVVHVTAAEGIELLMPEFGQSLDRFSIVDFAPSRRIDDEGRTVATHRYTLEPPISGTQVIPPILVEFIDRRPDAKPAPEGEDAYELVTERLTFEVASVLPTDVEADLEPPLGTLEALAEPGSGKTLWITAALFLVGGGIIGFFAFQRMQGAARRRSAYDVAKTRLSLLMARPRPGPDAIDAFFVELSAIVRLYLEDRFDLRSPELTTEEFLEVASGRPDLNDSHRGFLREFLRSADMVKFARFIPGSEEIESALAAASSFLDQTREAENA